MSDAEDLVPQIASWLDRFVQATADWQLWLDQIEAEYLAGNFQRLVEMESTGLLLQNELAETFAARRELLRTAEASGISARHLSGLLDRLDALVPLTLKVKLREATRQLRHAHQRSAALWITGFQSAGYAAALLDILATGDPNRATYSPGERDALEGGRLVDAAA